MSPAVDQSSSVASLRQQGWDQFRRGRLAQAEDCLRRAVQQQPDDAVLHHNLGVVLARSGQAAQALPFAPDWRWLRERTDTPWYPTMRLFRQPQAGDWPSVFADMAAELHRQVGRKSPEKSPAPP